MMAIRRLRAPALAAVTALTLASGCKSHPSSSTASGGCPAKSSVTVAISSMPNTLDWNTSNDASAQNYPVLLAMMHGLTSFDDKHNPVPMLAESWDVSPDKQTYTFHLRKDVVWSDGKTPLTANDFVFGWKRALVGANRGEFDDLAGTQAVLDAIHNHASKDEVERQLANVGVNAIDANTLRVTLVSPRSFFLAHVAYVYAFFPAPSADLAPLVHDDEAVQKYFNEPRDGKPMVLGAFTMTRWNRAAHEVDLTANPYDRFAPKTGRVEHVKLSESALGALAYDQCAIDFLLVDDPPARAHPPPDMQTSQLLSVYWLGLNTAKVPLHLRRAISRAIDRNALFTPLAPELPQLRIGSTFLPPEMPGALPASDPARAKLPQLDLAAARAELAESGYKGEELTLLVRGTETFLPEAAIADGLSHQLAAVGIKVKVATTSSFDADVKDPATGATRPHLFLKRTGADYAHPQTLLTIFERDGVNYTGWQTTDGGAPVSAFGRLLAQGAAESDMGKAAGIYGQAEQLIETDQAIVVPLFYPNRYYRTRSWIQGLAVDPFNFLSLAGMHVADGMLDAGR
jgi:peptide/nickel transport system substrate-binding protein